MSPPLQKGRERSYSFEKWDRCVKTYKLIFFNWPFSSHRTHTPGLVLPPPPKTYNCRFYKFCQWIHLVRQHNHWSNSHILNRVNCQMKKQKRCHPCRFLPHLMKLLKSEPRSVFCKFISFIKKTDQFQYRVGYYLEVSTHNVTLIRLRKEEKLVRFLSIFRI